MTSTWLRRYRSCLVAALSAFLVSLGLTACAQATPGQLFIFQDGSLYRTSPGDQTRLLDELVSLGVDTIHVQLPWQYIAPKPYSSRKPKGFKGTSPAEYPAANWGPYDRLVRAASARGLKLLFTPMPPVPYWIMRKFPRGPAFAPFRRYVKYFGRFVQAIGTRYSGSYRAEDGSGILPRVSFWSIGNEFNWPGWIEPEWAMSPLLGYRVAVAPRVYREVYRAAASALRRSGHGSDPLLIGELSPYGVRYGKRSDPMAPGVFLREFFCLDNRYRPFYGVERKVRGCTHFHKIRTAGLAVHPAPWDYWNSARYRPKSRDNISMATLPRLTKLLDRAAARGRVAKGLPIYVTEFWVYTGAIQSGTGDPQEVNWLKRQATNMNIGEYLAYRSGRIKSFTQYQYADDGNWYSGLRFGDLAPKPAYDAYRLPIFVRCESADKLQIWGLVRPLNTAPGPRKVQIEAGIDDSFVPLGDPIDVVDPRGYFNTTVTYEKATTLQWRFSWTDAAGQTYSSRAAVPFNAVTRNGSCKSNEEAPALPSQDPSVPPSDQLPPDSDR